MQQNKISSKPDDKVKLCPQDALPACRPKAISATTPDDFGSVVSSTATVAATMAVC